MKRLIICVVILISITGCGDLFKSQNKVEIKGQIAAVSKTNGFYVKSTNSLTLADARKVLFYFGIQDISIVDIVDGSFSTSAEIGRVAAMVFLDANNKYIGTFLNRGINFLPLGNLSEWRSTVSFQKDPNLNF